MDNLKIEWLKGMPEEKINKNELLGFTEKVNNTTEDQIEIKELRKEFIGRGEVKGFKFRQIHNAKQGYLYEITSDGIKHYEVFKKRINRRFATYSYPSSKSFGICAFTFRDYDKALFKLRSFNFRSLNKKGARYEAS